MNIIYVVMAISLTCLVAFGGISYINPDAPIRAVASRGLVAQYEAIHSGIVAYRSSNNGITPDAIALFKGFLPQGDIPSFGPAYNGYGWSMSVPQGETRPVICLTVNDSSEAKIQSSLAFATEIERRSSAKVSLGGTCGDNTPFAQVVVADIPTVPVLTIRGF